MTAAERFEDERRRVAALQEQQNIAEMIANWFGRSVIDADLDLATAIITRIRGGERRDI